jgi:hypothetical protein
LLKLAALAYKNETYEALAKAADPEIYNSEFYQLTF